MVLMALQLWGVYNFIPATHLISKSTKRGYGGAFLAGVLGGVFSSPCATPVLVVLLAFVAVQDSILWGVLLLLMYSIGHGVLTVVAGTSVGFAQRLSQDKRYGRLGTVLNIVLGALVLLLGFYMFYLAF